MRSKIFVIIIGVVITFLIPAGFLFRLPTSDLYPTVQIYFFDVGQGDAILLRTAEGKDVLIDGGPGQKIIHELSRVLPFYDRDIDLVVLTHAHADHAAGLIEIFKRYHVGQVLYSGSVDHSSETWRTWLDTVKEKSIPLRVVQARETILLRNSVELQILYPFEDYSEKTIENLNDTSVVARLDAGDIEFLFMGDASSDIERVLVGRGIALDAEVLKVGHHGSRSSSDAEFLRVVNPDYAVIQSGKGNRFGHPHLSTLRRLRKETMAIFRNDTCGTIVFQTDGRRLMQKTSCR